MKVVVQELPQRSLSRYYIGFLIKRSKKIIFEIVLIILFPIIILVINTKVFFITKNIVYKKNIAASKYYFSYIYKTLKLNRILIDLYSKVPLVQSFYKFPKAYSDILIKSSAIAYEKAELEQFVGLITNNIVTDRDFNLDELVSRAALEVNNIIEDEGFLFSETRSIRKGFLLSKIYPESYFDISPDVTLLKKYKYILSNLSSILGENEERKYAAVFQNTNIIRPTGGKIASLAILTFNKGRLVDSQLLFPEEIDKKILGEIVPPYPLNKDNNKWSFYDANWSSDIVASAQQIEWFVNHSFEIKLDGVVFINSNISSNDDLMQRLTRLSEHGPERSTQIINSLLQDNDKNILFYFNREDEMNLAQSVGLSNIISTVNCEHCLNDYLGMVESEIDSIGYNNAIEREARLEISIQGSIIKKNLKLTFKRKFDNDDYYRIYLRLLAPRGFSFSPVTIDDKKYFAEQGGQGGFNQMGLIIDFDTKFKQKTLEVSLEGAQPLSKVFNNYSFRWVKQPGVSNFYSSVGIDFTSTEIHQITSNESLTQSTAGSYDGVRERTCFASNELNPIATSSFNTNSLDEHKGRCYNTNLLPFNNDIEVNLYY